MASEFANARRSAYYHLARIARVRDSLTTSVCKCLVHAFVTSCIDYGNAMLRGIPDRLIHLLEMVQRSAARIVLHIRRGDRQSTSEVLRELHWLPVKKRTEYILSVLVHYALYEGTPVYLALLMQRHTPRRSLQSAGVPLVNVEWYGRRSFACARHCGTLYQLHQGTPGIAQSSKRH